MSSKDHQIHLLITDTVSKIHELQNPIELLNKMKQRDEEFCKIQKEIRSLYNDCQKESNSSFNKDLAKDIIENVTDGRFEEFYKSKPKFLKCVDADIHETIKHVEIVKKELKNMDESCVGEKSDSLKTLVDIYKDQHGVPSGDILAKCVDGFEKFKRNFENIDVNEDLIKNSKRDFPLEEIMNKMIADIKEFQQVIDARQTISSLCDAQQETQDLDNSPNILTHHISNLLKDVERLNYSEPDEHKHSCL